jgi:predicted XRE-type DNA-binding protein
MPKRKLSSTSVVPSSGNVFADLRLPDAEEKQTKIQLAVVINQIIETTGPSQVAANRLHVNQPEISALANYGLNGFSMNG